MSGLSTEQGEEVLTKDAVECAIEDEVDCRVDGQQQVSYLSDTPHHVVRLVIPETVHRRDDRVWRHAQHEHYDNGHEHDGDAASRRQAALRRLLRAAQRAHDEVAERAQYGDGDERAHAVLRPRIGDDEAAHAPQLRDVDVNRCGVRVVLVDEHRSISEGEG